MLDGAFERFFTALGSFRQRSVKERYLCVAEGRYQDFEGQIETMDHVYNMFRTISSTTTYNIRQKMFCDIWPPPSWAR